jgi:hypothetical protein
MKHIFTISTLLILIILKSYSQKISKDSINKILLATADLGSKSSLNLVYNNGVTQIYNFHKTPLSVSNNEFDTSFHILYSNKSNELFENMLKGINELEKRDSILTLELKKYDGCECERKNINFGVIISLNHCSTKAESLYKSLKNSVSIIDFGEYWSKYKNKIWPHNADYGFFFTTNENERFSRYFISYRIELKDLVFNRKYYLFYRGMQYTNIPDKKSYMVLENATKKFSEIIISESEKHTFIENFTGLNNNYFKIKEEKRIIYESIQILKNNYFLNIKDKTSSDENLKYVGFIENGIPNGFGLLLNTENKIILSSFWEEGFPVFIYKVNLYYNVNTLDRLVTYYNKFTSKHKDKKLQIYKNNLYVGQEKYDGYSIGGYGCQFYSDVKKDETLKYYIGEWDKNELNGKGSLFINNISYTGIFKNHTLNTGTSNWPNGDYYKGDFLNFQMHGMGKKIYKNGKIEEGLFEYGKLLKSKSQIDQENIQEEQRRIKERERKEEELRLAEQKREEKLRNAVLIKNPYELIDNPSKYFGEVIMMIGSPGKNNAPFDSRNTKDIIPDGYYRNEQFKGSQFYVDNMRTSWEYINWKQIIEKNTRIDFYINIPNKFFELEKIPSNQGNSLYVFYLEVYPGNENRSSSSKGKYLYYDSYYRGQAAFELLDIKRY